MDQVNYYENKLAFEIDSWDLHEAMKSTKQVVVLDVRGEVAYSKKHIKGAIHYPHSQIIEDNRGDFDSATLYVTYCDGLGCNAATNGALKLAKLGFKVVELSGGLTWWDEHDYPTVNAES
ncbi:MULTISPECIES: rhodanese-like domain-containing protein [Pseudoalteromonas]|uniref:rhodanese-like domain-containing protein n=1 Tax=Pseudoalteromonas TaxID=53246 RepID=UPI000FFE5E20|nr:MULTISPECIES: rhodanese-like domain-containing protein [Pseudoalteromonas]MCG9760812.1 sulfurtransferase [Pseudoalteromonas sp. Isolate6]NKC17343.1 rhodanese-like domain-containing protein [Pseudoalteromonas galatheae]RXE84608.1 rhodanese-like domain-containing protein [Pseudoalteromonas sp. A757]